MIGSSAQDFASRAIEAAQRGDKPGALVILAQATKAHPNDARLWHYTASLMLQTGNPQGAAKNFGKALALEPGNFDFAIDQAIALSACDCYREALDILAGIEQVARHHAHYWSTRANAARGLRNLSKAAQWYDKALAIEPARPKALQGRASVALERGEADATARFDKALAVVQNDPQTWLGKAQALDAEGRSAEAREIGEMLVRELPQWTDALRFLSQIRIGAGEKDFASHFAEAQRLHPEDPALVHAHVGVLDAHDLHAEALLVAASAHALMPDDPAMALLEAVQASSAREDVRAEALFAALKLETSERWLHEARHCLRTDDLARCETLLERVIAEDPGHVSAWALRDLVWRVIGDRRAQWLHGQEGLVRIIPLPDAEAVLAEAVPLLTTLHDSSLFPLGQSLRGGTQTRGNLFDRAESALARLQSSLKTALEDYRAGLPPVDVAHPLLRHRDEAWAITGSWSVRLAGGGDHHAPHLHPQGLLSSACYLLLPDAAIEDSLAGWIELGRPAPDLRLDFPPLYTLEPKAGHLALFPSTLYHGTRPFAHGSRMTVAFDVTLAEAAQR